MSLYRDYRVSVGSGLEEAITSDKSHVLDANDYPELMRCEENKASTRVFCIALSCETWTTIDKESPEDIWFRQSHEATITT